MTRRASLARERRLTDSPKDAPLTAVARMLPALAGWVVGMLLAFRDTILSRFARMQGEPIDVRFVTYTLEHGYRWLQQAPAHQSLWSPPIFFPAPDTFAYSDTLLSAAPIYWLLRAFSLPPDTALQWWMLTVATLDYVTFYVLLRRGLGLGRVASALGALLFAFGGVRIAQIRHQQLLPHFYAVLALFALLRIFQQRPDEGGGRRALRWPLLFTVSVVAELYASVYLGWFLVLALLIAALWALAIPPYRTALVACLRRRAPALAVASLIALALVAPLAWQYLHAALEAGYGDPKLTISLLPRLQSWIYLGPDSWLYNRVSQFDIIRNMEMEHEHRLGFGVATTLCAAWGLWSQRRRPLAALLGLTALTLIVLAMQWPGGASAWPWVSALVPGARAIRAVSRVALMVLIPVAIGIALCVERWRTRPLLVIALAIAVVWEQGQRLMTYDKLAVRVRAGFIAARIDPKCRSFLFTALHDREDPWLYNVDAMWAELAVAVPTVNGYSGRTPPHWPMYDAVVRDTASAARLDRDLSIWLRLWNRTPEVVCRVTFDLDAVAPVRR